MKTSAVLFRPWNLVVTSRKTARILPERVTKGIVFGLAIFARFVFCGKHPMFKQDYIKSYTSFSLGELNIMPPKLGSCDWETASKNSICIFILYVSKILYFLHVQGFHFQSFLRGVWGTSYLAIGAQPCFLPKLPTLGGGTMYGTYFHCHSTLYPPWN